MPMQWKKLCVVLALTPLLLGMKGLDYSQVTEDQEIKNAIECMDGTVAEWSQRVILGDNMSGKPIPISFMDLEQELGEQAKNALAVCVSIPPSRNVYIFVDEKMRGVPKEALATILAHETKHASDSFNSKEEETAAFTFEGQVWHDMIQKNKLVKFNKHFLVQRLNLLESKYVEGGYSAKEIRPIVYAIPGYKGLPKYSPGFENVR